ncbi:MAG: long-chain fatty acid--CoA ligase [Anaerolineae bacterium]
MEGSSHGGWSAEGEQMHAGDLLADRARLTPEREALTELATGRRYSYGRLNERANRLANWLRGLGLGKGDRVSILAHNGVAYLDLLYGLPKIGAVLAPLNWRLVARELSYIVGDCQPRVLICGPEFVDLLEEMRPGLEVEHVVALDGAQIEGALSYEEGLAAAAAVEAWRPPLAGDDVYAILYTSGTTGRPKGAMIPHRQVLWNCINTVASWGLREDDVSPVLTPLFHAGGLFAFLTPLYYVGGRVVLARGFQPEDSLRAIADEGCTVILGVPTLYQMWLEADNLSAVDLSAVRFFINGGAAMPRPLARAWLEAVGGVLRQGYGLTEVGVNCFSMTDAESLSHPGSVGKPILHSQMRIVDPETGEEMPPGEAGELSIYGPHVCIGYWHNPEATAQALRDGWFHTGDMARRDAEGYYYIVGRYKDMIKSGGENVYAAEVEAVFREHPAVAEAALIGQPHERWGEVGLMVTVLHPGQDASGEDLLAFCRGRLARFKIPKRVVFVEALPYSPYGKVMKEELKERFVG